MATRRDYYDVLGVPRNATEDQIRSAYRQQALRYHPDRNKEDGAAERFKEVTEAYEVLRDSEKRSMYDRFGHAGTETPFGATGFACVPTTGPPTCAMAGASGTASRPRPSARAGRMRAFMCLVPAVRP